MKYFVFSNYINAWSIAKGLNNLGLKLEAITDKSYLLPNSKNIPIAGDTLFFTEESSLKEYYYKSEFNFYPRELKFDIIDDKFHFAKFMLTIGESPIPFWEFNNKNREEYPIFLKAKHSWLEKTKLPRGYILYSENDYSNAIRDIETKKISFEHFFYQKLLSSPITNNISVSGFFDYKNNDRNLMIVTRKLMGNGRKISTGTMVKIINDPANLISRTKKILNSLKYSGPFELEFFYESDDSIYYVLELNPRFWMQHGLFIDYFNNGLIKRYLNIDTKEDWYFKNIPIKPVVWVNNINNIHTLFRATKSKFGKDIEMLKGSEVAYYPDFFSSFKYVSESTFRKCFKSIFS